jgi:TnpA family transposase
MDRSITLRNLREALNSTTYDDFLARGGGIDDRYWQEKYQDLQVLRNTLAVFSSTFLLQVVGLQP